MTDVLTKEQRQFNMSRIRAQDTKPEMLIRQGLHARGLRYRLHDQKLPGRPDLVFARYHAVVFVHGCFWHRHDCHLSKLPATRQDFWRRKLVGNVERDRKAIDTLHAAGWRVLVIWECALRGTGRLGDTNVLDRAARYIRQKQCGLLVEIVGENGVHNIEQASD